VRTQDFYKQKEFSFIKAAILSVNN